MIRIDLYAVLGSTIASVSWLNLNADTPEQPPQKLSLSYVKSDEPMTGDALDVLQELVALALENADEEAMNQGGWSTLT